MTHFAEGEKNAKIVPAWQKAVTALTILFVAEEKSARIVPV